VAIEKFELKAVRPDGHQDAPEPAEQAVAASEPEVSTFEGPDEAQPGSDAVRGMLFGVGFGLLLWGLLAGVTVTLNMLLR
jgi:hypothetical protein